MTSFVVYSAESPDGVPSARLLTMEEAINWIEEEIDDTVECESVLDNRGGFEAWEVWPEMWTEEDAPYKIVKEG